MVNKLRNAIVEDESSHAELMKHYIGEWARKQEAQARYHEKNIGSNHEIWHQCIVPNLFFYFLKKKAFCTYNVVRNKRLIGRSYLWKKQSGGAAVLVKK